MSGEKAYDMAGRMNFWREFLEFGRETFNFGGKNEI